MLFDHIIKILLFSDETCMYAIVFVRSAEKSKNFHTLISGGVGFKDKGVLHNFNGSK